MSLHSFFQPHSVALIGATEREGSVGRAIWENLRLFSGKVFPVNVKRSEVFGVKAFPNIAALPEVPDLVMVVTPAATVPQIVEDAGVAGVKAVVVISAGFKETGAQGSDLEKQTLEAAKRHGVRLIGPNCLGLMNPHTGLNATFASSMARPGRVAFLSQSGALCTAILDWSHDQHVGFSAFVSTGAMADVGWGDLIRHFGNDPHTQSIVMYMESVGGDATAFLEAAREVAAHKPIVVIKVGRTAEASKAAASHTGAMTGSDAVLDAALRQSGVLRVDTIEELFDMAEVLAKQPLPVGPRLAIVTNAGGPGALATDALVLGGGEVAPLSDETLDALDEVLPESWSHHNPVDVLGDADAARFATALRVAKNDAIVDGVLAILTPQAMTNPTATARELVNVVKENGKPLLASWMGAQSVNEGRGILNAAGVPTYDYPDEAALAFVRMREHRLRLLWLSETREAHAEHEGEELPVVGDMIDAVLKSGRTLLTELEAKQLLQVAGIPIVETRAAYDEDAAVSAAEAIGFPVVVKLLSATITHKSDCGGVMLDLRDANAVRQAWRTIRSNVAAKHDVAAFEGVTVQRMITGQGTELILGASTDPQFGPVLLVGAGGTLVEVLQDRALALPPLNRALARRWIEQTKIFKVLKGVRGRPPADLAALEEALVRFARLVHQERRIVELDINPLLTSAEGVVALDARVVVRQ
ncbi:MAG: acetate--CoA ligase family protein [Prosthecobacter sp.]|jgi:acetyltransferase|uniref:acetate--CoA ligase family protein n=1 Tax=Prosthecobacter sp. TaxID=1965333 RepID=UPI0019D8949F|nr:acetate--CoA ligase family protein [Prosthecobacter sp.]MBE2282746.1 acetate--CoA ligase family protein [Prosthecobacter sp.]